LRKYLSSADSDWFRRRLNTAAYIVIAVFVVLLTRLFFLQVIEGQEFRRLSENNCVRLQSIDAPRGLIFDRNGKLLVDNRPSFNLGVIVKDVKNLEATMEKLSGYMNIPFTELMAKVTAKNAAAFYKPVSIKNDIGRNALAAIEVNRFNLPGVVVNVKPIRSYINRFSAAHLIGYLSEINSRELSEKKEQGYCRGDFLGKFGIEKRYEQYFRGKRGGRQVEVNAAGQVLRILRTVDAVPGFNIYLTIDQRLQKKAESLIGNRAGSVIAMDPSTGQILALVSSPTFDQNFFVSGMSHKQWNDLISNPDRPMENKAIQAEYPPASVFKIVTVMAGLEEGVIDEETTFNCPGSYRYGDRTFNCWKRGGHGSVNVVKALAESCDVFFYNLGQELGVDRIAHYAKACGLGSPTGINLGHEACGLIPTTEWKRKHTGESWHGGETLSVAIGQGYDLVTPLQVGVLIAAVANGGIIYSPQILKTIETAQGELIKIGSCRVAGNLPISRQTLDIIKKGLWEAVNTRKGTAWGARSGMFEMSGKTGTAQVVGRVEGESEDEKDRAVHLMPHAWFAAFAPSDKPEIAVTVIVEHGEHGSSAAAPIAKELINMYLQDVKKDKASACTASSLHGEGVEDVR